MFLARARGRDDEADALRIGASLDLERAAVELVAVAEVLERQVRTDAVERAQVDALVDAEKAQPDRGLGADLEALGRVLGPAQLETGEADLLAVEDDAGPQLLPGPLCERARLRLRRRVACGVKEGFGGRAAGEQAGEGEREAANQSFSNLSDAELMQ